ncbi:MAG: hypothetical protein Q9M34_07115 [Sulfurimonas sp.]|nr:hypothetical protein [Sulfurimonas sp.]
MNVPNIKHIGHRVIKKVKLHVQKVSKYIYEDGDPDFVDERIEPKESKKEKSFFDFLFT